jgi:hypothetical protein
VWINHNLFFNIKMVITVTVSTTVKTVLSGLFRGPEPLFKTLDEIAKIIPHVLCKWPDFSCIKPSIIFARTQYQRWLVESLSHTLGSSMLHQRMSKQSFVFVLDSMTKKLSRWKAELCHHLLEGHILLKCH